MITCIWRRGGLAGLSHSRPGANGVGADANRHIDGVAPYWRGTWQMDLGAQYFSAGVFGLNTKLHPDPTLPATDRFDDVGFDATYQYTKDSHGLAANFALI